MLSRINSSFIGAFSRNFLPEANTILSPHFFQTTSFFSSSINYWNEKLKIPAKVLSLESEEDLDPEKLKDLVEAIKKTSHIPIQNITLPHQHITKEWMENFLSALKIKIPILPAIGVQNPNGFLRKFVVFSQPDSQRLESMTPLLTGEKPAIWAYQMQKIPLENKEIIKKIASQIEQLHSHNIVVISLDPEASSIWKGQSRLC